MSDSHPSVSMQGYNDWLSRLSNSQLRRQTRMQAARTCAVRARAGEIQAVEKRILPFLKKLKRLRKHGTGKLKFISDYRRRVFTSHNEWLIKLSERKLQEQASARAARVCAAEARMAKERAIRDAVEKKRDEVWSKLQAVEASSLTAVLRVYFEEKRIERAWKTMERWYAVAEQLSEDKREIVEIRTQAAAEEVRAATKEIHVAKKEIEAAQEEQPVLLGQLQSAEKTLQPTGLAPCPRDDSEKTNAFVENLMFMSTTLFIRHPIIPLVAVLVTASAGKTLVGALIGSALLGISFAPPLLALVIIGLAYLKHKANKPTARPRYSFFYVDTEEHRADAARRASLMDKEDKSRDDPVPDKLVIP